MIQEERLDFLIKALVGEQEAYRDLSIPAGFADKKRLLRSLMNVRLPAPISTEFLKVQDAYLQEQLAQRCITKMENLSPVKPGIYLWRGDITTLAVDAIVNAANSRMLGCFVPCHGCIDNAIHSTAGIQLRLECAQIMTKQWAEEPVGRAKITRAYNLPCKYVLHTVGPFICDSVTKNDRELLACCYRSCLRLASDYGLKSVAFCCISTGEFHFPNELAAQIATQAVQDWQRKNPDKIEVIFNVFKDHDYAIYQRLLG